MRIKHWALLGIVFLLLSPCFFFMISQQVLDRGIKQLQDELSSQGYCLAYAKKSSGGFPLTYRRYLHDISVRQENGWRLKVPLLKIEIKPRSLFQKKVFFTTYGMMQVLFLKQKQRVIAEGLEGVIRPLKEDFLCDLTIKRANRFKGALIREKFTGLKIRLMQNVFLQFFCESQVNLPVLQTDMRRIKGRILIKGSLQPDKEKAEARRLFIEHYQARFRHFSVRGSGQFAFDLTQPQGRFSMFFDSKESILAFFHKIFSFQFRRTVEVQKLLEALMPILLQKNRPLTILLDQGCLRFQEIPWLNVPLS